MKMPLRSMIMATIWLGIFHSASSSILSFLGITKNYPTLEVIPVTKSRDESMNWFQISNPNSYKPYVNSITELLQGYDRPEKIDVCDYQKYSEGIPCDINMKYFGPCGLDYSPATAFGYNTGRPCVYLKLKLNDWTPEYYSNYTELPSNMPQIIKHSFNSVSSQDKKKTLYISCGGDDVASKENIGLLEYFPSNGIGDKFLHKDTPNYTDPIIAVQFLSPYLGVLVNVQCHVWAKNSDTNKAVLKFGIMVDK